MTEGKPVLFITVGATHYQFDRLVRWVDAWLGSDAGSRVRCLAQHGPSAPPARAECRPYLPYQDVLEAMRQASVAVCHGGPGSITLARRFGLRPIVVPRLRSLGECVDDHQVAFARRMVKLGDIEIAETEDQLRALLDAFTEGRLETRTSPQVSEDGPVVHRFQELVDQMMASDGRGR